MKKELRFGFALMAIILLVVVVFMPWTTLTNGHLGLLMLALIVVAIMLGFPTAFTLMGMGVFFAYLAYHSSSPEIAARQTLDLMVQRAYAVMSNDVLISIPLFVFMGYLVERANLIAQLFRSIHLALARLPGSLAVATLVTCAIFATATGIVGAVVTLMGLLAFPAMLKAGYDIRLSAGVITAGGCLGILIPPSVLLIVYGATAGVSVVQLYAGAFFPGLMLAGLYVVYVIVVAKLKPQLAPPLSAEDRRVELPGWVAAMKKSAGDHVVPALLSAIKGRANVAVPMRTLLLHLLIAVLPLLAWGGAMGLVYRSLTAPVEIYDTSGLQQMGAGAAAVEEAASDQPQAAGISEPPAEETPSAPGISEPPEQEAPGISEPPAAASATAAGVAEPPTDSGTKPPSLAEPPSAAEPRSLAEPPGSADSSAASTDALPEPPPELPVVPRAAPLSFWIVLAVGSTALLAGYALFNFARMEIFKMLLSSFFPLAVMILAVLGSIVFGLATPTEAAAVGSLGGLLLAAAYRQLNLTVLKESVFLTAKTSAMVCWLFVGSSIFSAAFALLGGQELIERWVLSMALTPLQFMLLAQFIIFILGWPLEWTEIIVIFMPIFIPLLAHFHIDPLFFGLLVALNLQTAFLSPPVAMAAFYLKGVAPPHVTLNQIFAGMLPFMAIQVVAMFLLYLFPAIGLWLPKVLYQ
ncbi:MAG TPA: TRAP transporter large permease subunit [Rhodocyclaceae bacterium]|nr:TRAP transporter large permease subunit [Rhodocyclaceae bacterium]